MKTLIKKLLREGLIKESYELIPYYDDVDLSDYNIDEDEAYNEAHEIAKDGGVQILRDKELHSLLLDTNGNRVIGGLWVSNDSNVFSFDVAIDSGYQNIGLSDKLIVAAIDEFNQQKEVYGDDLEMEVDVINPKLASILANKYGFYKTADIDQNRVLMSLNEGMMNNKTLMNKFIDFVNDYLELESPCTINLTRDREDITTTAYYDIVNHHICVYIKDRAIMDVMRSLAHELVHHHQNERGDLLGRAEEGADGSPLENEANSKAGEIIRVFGRQNPEIYTNNN